MTTQETEATPAGDGFASFDPVVADVADVAAVRAAAPSLFAAAAEFWRVPLAGAHLSLRVKELVLLAMHASPTSLNTLAVERHVRRARAAGATDADILDVLVTIVGVANHALYASVPVLESELEAAGGIGMPTQDPGPGYETAKQEFIEARGFWNPDRDSIARQLPEYFTALTGISTVSWKDGPLSAKEREFMCIAVDCAVTHNYEPGLRLHIRNALGHGATRQEILEIFQLAALTGLEGYLMGARALFGGDRRG